MRSFSKAALALSLVTAPCLAWSATYTVGPSGRQYTQLSAVFANNNLAPGDIVEVDGNATYNGNIVVNSDDGGDVGNPVIIRWKRAAGQSRPLLQGGTNTIKFQRSNNVVFEGFEITGGSNTCIFSEAHNVTVRDAVIRNCPSHGILAADQNSGSFTLEYSEIRNSGSGSQRHPIYMQSDEVAFPGAVFRMQFNYIHSGTGGNLVKVRHERAEIYYNWLEGATYQALELIGPDCATQQSGWNAGLRREDSDIVGNVIVQSGSWANAIRIGGDLNGRSQGRVRLVNNTILFTRSGTANAVMVQLGAGSLEMHNNVIHQTSSGSPTVLVENSSAETPYCGPTGTSAWDAGRKVAGSNNWVKSGAGNVPGEWTGTRNGSDPGLTSVAQWNLRPASSSVLVGNGSNPPPTPTAFPFPSPQLIPLFDPPSRAKLDLNGQRSRVLSGARLSIGALEAAGGTEPTQPVRVNGSQPLQPGSASAATGAASVPTALSPAPAATAGAVPRVPSLTGAAAADTTTTARRVRKYVTQPSQPRYRRWAAPAVSWCDTEESAEGERSICKRP